MPSKTIHAFQFGRTLHGRVSVAGPAAEYVIEEFHAYCVRLGWRVSPIVKRTIPAAPKAKR